MKRIKTEDFSGEKFKMKEPEYNKEFLEKEREKEKKMPNRSLNFIRKKLKQNYKSKTNSLEIPGNSQDLFVAKDYVKKLFEEKYNTIWTDEGMTCELKDKDTGKTKTINIKYNNDVKYNTWVYTTSLGLAESEKGTYNFVRNITNLVEKVLWDSVDVCELMPINYDIEFEKEKYTEYYNKYKESGKEGFENLISPDDRFANVIETYFDYDVNYTIGDFICFKDTKPEYNIEAVATGELDTKDDKGNKVSIGDKPVSRYFTALPVCIEYKYRLPEAVDFEEVVEDKTTINNTEADNTELTETEIIVEDIPEVISDTVGTVSDVEVIDEANNENKD